MTGVTANAAAFDAEGDAVFTRIAGRYDFLCDFFSLGFHRLWKARMARAMAPHARGVLLDIASGTGDIPLRLIRRSPLEAGDVTLIVSDICPAMLDVAQSRIGTKDPRITYRIENAHGLDGIADGSVDLVSISFGMKICDRAAVLAAAQRVLRPGGRFFCLEAARIPARPIHTAYLRYMDWCVPVIGRIATGGDKAAYEYLLRGIHGFPDQAAFAMEMEDHGFVAVGYENLTAGIVALHRGRKPA